MLFVRGIVAIDDFRFSPKKNLKQICISLHAVRSGFPQKIKIIGVTNEGKRIAYFHAYGWKARLGRLELILVEKVSYL